MLFYKETNALAEKGKALAEKEKASVNLTSRSADALTLYYIVCAGLPRLVDLAQTIHTALNSLLVEGDQLVVTLRQRLLKTCDDALEL